MKNAISTLILIISISYSFNNSDFDLNKISLTMSDIPNVIKSKDGLIREKANTEIQSNNSDNNSQCLQFSLESKFNPEEECNINLDSTIKINKRLFTKDNHSKNLVSYWSFDYERIIDEVNGKNNSVGKYSVGPGITGKGNSLLLNSDSITKDNFSIEMNQNLDNTFSYSFWIYMNSIFSSSDSECRILQRGKDVLNTESNNSYQRYPGIFVNSKSKRFNIYINTVNDLGNSPGSQLLSNGRIIIGQWINLTLTKDSNEITLYLNGLKDKSIEAKSVLYNSPDLTNKLFFGNKNLSFMIDEIRIFKSVLDIDYIQASISGFISNASYLSQFTLGCNNCLLEEAVLSCQNTHQICSSLELHLGGYTIAKSVGWLYKGVRMWSKEALKNLEELKSKKGLAMCCLIET